MNKTKLICQGAVVAALYVVLTMVSAILGLSSGVIQVRISEALCILPAFTGAAVPGLWVGCLIANLITGANALDVIFGSLATLIGAVGTYALKKRPYIGAFMPVISNAVIVPFVLKYAYEFDGSILYFAVTVGAGEIISAAFLGSVLIFCLQKRKMKNIF